MGVPFAVFCVVRYLEEPDTAADSASEFTMLAESFEAPDQDVDLLLEGSGRVLEREGDELRAAEGFDPVKDVKADAVSLGSTAQGAPSVSTRVRQHPDMASVDVTNEASHSPAVAYATDDKAVRVFDGLDKVDACLVLLGVDRTDLVLTVRGWEGIDG